jgi:hypothetical protein
MPTPPLSDHIADQLRGDPTSALFVIASVHREMFSWVARTICGDGATEPRLGSNGAARRGRKGNAFSRSSEGLETGKTYRVV